MNEDAELLARFARSGSEDAFSELVSRRIQLVYSVALRRTQRPPLANDVTQVVFTKLARRAAQLVDHPTLVGWLHRCAWNTAADVMRAEHARTKREQEARITHMTLSSDGPSTDWENARPVIDEVLLQLEERDRDAILLRFFDHRSWSEIGEQLHLAENTARMKVQRALDKLHRLLVSRGITSTHAALAAALAQHATATVPAGLAGVVTAASVTSASHGILATLFLTMNTLKFATTAIVVVGALSTALIVSNGNSQERKNLSSTANPPPTRHSASKTQPIAQRSDAVTSTETGSAISNETSRAATASKLEQGEWVSSKELADRGKSTPKAAFETFLWAQENGDVDKLENVLFLDRAAQASAEQFFVRLSPEKRGEFGSPGRLVAYFMIGGAAAFTNQSNLPHYSHQIFSDEMGMNFAPEAFNLTEAAASDSGYHTFRAKRRGDNAKEYLYNCVVHQTPDGWRLMISSSQIVAFSRRLAQKDPGLTAKN